MSCLLSNGVSRTCDYTVGGIDGSVWIANKDDVESMAYDTDGQVSGVTMVSGASWYEFQPELSSASLAQSLQTGQVSRFVQQTVVFSIASLTQAKIKTLDDLSLSTMVVIMKGNDGNWYFVGDNGSGLKANAVEQTSGAADTDDAIVTATLQGSNKGYAPTVDSSILSGLGIS